MLSVSPSRSPFNQIFATVSMPWNVRFTKLSGASSSAVNVNNLSRFLALPCYLSYPSQRWCYRSMSCWQSNADWYHSQLRADHHTFPPVPCTRRKESLPHWKCRLQLSNISLRKLFFLVFFAFSQITGIAVNGIYNQLISNQVSIVDVSLPYLIGSETYTAHSARGDRDSCKSLFNLAMNQAIWFFAIRHQFRVPLPTRLLVLKGPTIG